MSCELDLIRDIKSDQVGAEIRHLADRFRTFWITACYFTRVSIIVYSSSIVDRYDRDHNDLLNRPKIMQYVTTRQTKSRLDVAIFTAV